MSKQALTKVAAFRQRGFGGTCVKNCVSLLCPSKKNDWFLDWPQIRVLVRAASACKNHTYSPGSRTYLTVENLEGRLRDDDHPKHIVSNHKLLAFCLM